MDSFNKFIADNYILVICISVFILFTLIGYLSDLIKTSKTKSRDKEKELIPHPDLKEKKSMGIADIVKPENDIKQNVEAPVNVEDSFAVSEIIPEINNEVKIDEPVVGTFDSFNSIPENNLNTVESVSTVPTEDLNTTPIVEEINASPIVQEPIISPIVEEPNTNEVKPQDVVIKDEFPSEENDEDADKYTIKKFD